MPPRQALTTELSPALLRECYARFFPPTQVHTCVTLVPSWLSPGPKRTAVLVGTALATVAVGAAIAWRVWSRRHA